MAVLFIGTVIGYSKITISNSIVMKNKILFLSLVTTVLGLSAQAQYNTQVKPTNYEVSDNLDLRAVASIFGESQNIQDFERKLNDPEIAISNLDLNDDNEVDYLRVIETVERNTHVIVIQAVLDRDVYQDVATIDLEKDRNNTVQVQFIGNEFMYGQNYIYEPTYYSTPLIYASFWSSNYHPYVSTYRWNYYPNYYRAWNPFPVYRYRNNISVNININNRYNYVNARRSSHAAVIYNSRRSNGYERLHPNYAFSKRNTTVINRYELDQNRRSNRVSSRSSRTYADNRTSNRTARTSTYGDNRDTSRNNNYRSGNYRTRSTPIRESSNSKQRATASRTATPTSEQRSNRVESKRTSSATQRTVNATQNPNYSRERSEAQRAIPQRSNSRSARTASTPQRSNPAQSRSRETPRATRQDTTTRNNSARVNTARTGRSSANVSRSASQRSENSNNSSSRRSSSSLENRRS